MAKSENQKTKLFYLVKILREGTSKDHGMTMPEILDRLSAYGIRAERKSIYDDIAQINAFGEEILVERYRRDGKTFYYAVGQGLTLPDIKLLADTLAASRFVTERRATELIGKMERMVSMRERRELNRSVYISRHVTEQDDDGFGNVDPIHQAINKNRRIAFVYLRWNEKKELVPRGDERRVVSPLWLVYNNENYYLGAYDSARGAVRTFRVDKMRDVEILDLPREGTDLGAGGEESPKRYARARFFMYDGEEERVHILCPNGMVGMFLDMFGKDIRVMKHSATYSEVSFCTVPNRYFLGWLSALGNGVRLTAPQSAVDTMEAMCMSSLRNHERRAITTVLFDLGGVLLRLRPKEYMSELGLSAEACRFFDEHVLLKEEWLQMDRGILTQEEAMERWIAMRPDLEREIRLYMKDLTRLVEAYPDSEALLASLRERGYEVYALSNYPREMFACHEKSLPFFRHMNGLVISGRERRYKPNQDFYECFLERYKKTPGECVFIDDLADNTRAAEALGIHSISAAERDSGIAELQAFLAAHELA